MYQGWQIDLKNPLSDEVQLALQSYMAKYGTPPQVLEVSMLLEDVQLPEGLQVVKKVVRLPKNIMLLGVENANQE